MKKYFLILFLFPLFVFSQQQQAIDSLLQIFNDSTKNDTVRLKTAHWLVGAVLGGSSDLRFKISQEMQQLAHIKNQKEWESTAFMMMGLCMRDKGNYPMSNDYYLKH